ncbi:hypothetical protein [Nostoc sp. LEGE 12450]|uniref:hypothetical protein n=1 Tax=Nostoc sp. LEGE 12450 TaxID=1828643 RepID=UPI001D13A3EC|nr:hypothetical protein [Nostoc sp. LEGE 12450]
MPEQIQINRRRNWNATREATYQGIGQRDSLKANVTEQGEKLLGGKHIQGKLMSKVVNLLFQELCKVIHVA